MVDISTVEDICPSQDERPMAILAHVLQLVGGWIAPLIILLVKRDSKFVSFHPLQALLLQGLYFGLTMVGMALFFVAARVPMLSQHYKAHLSLFTAAFFFILPVIALGAMGWWLLMLAAAIVYGIKAGRGEWAEYLIFGRLARKILKIGPKGEEIV